MNMAQTSTVLLIDGSHLDRLRSKLSQKVDLRRLQVLVPCSLWSCLAIQGLVVGQGR